MRIMVGNTPNPTTLAVCAPASLQQWLALGGGSVPGVFLREQGLKPEELVALGFLQLGAGRWSDAFVAGPLLRPALSHEPGRCAQRNRSVR
jgi:hypothetical protein